MAKATSTNKYLKKAESFDFYLIFDLVSFNVKIFFSLI